MKNSFYLVIPRQHDEPKRLKEFEAKFLRQWLDELPTANLGLATRLIHDFVKELNTLNMPSQLRLDVLEKISPNVHIIEDYLQDKLLHSGFPKCETEEKIFNVLTSIQKECAIGYWCILKELTHRDAGWLKGQSTTLPIQRCIKKLGRIIVNYFIMRLPTPDWIWIDIHSLYKLNQKIEKNTVKVVNHFKQRATTYTSEECYKQILLFSLADVTGLSQKQIPQVYDFIASITTLVSLKNMAMLNYDQRCIILTDEDKPPYFQANPDVNSDSSVTYLDFTQLYRFMMQQEKLPNKPEVVFSSSMFGPRNHVTKPPKELWEYLQQRWFGVELQGSVLFADRLDRCVAIGLTLTHDLKSGMRSAHRTDNETTRNDIVAQSASDRLLSAVFKEPGQLLIGSLISFKKKDDPETNRSLGLVNKVGIISSGKITFSINLLTPRFHTVLYKQRNTGDDVPPQKGVFYTVKELSGEKNYVLTDYFMCEDDTVINLTIGEDEFPVLMKNRTNIGLGYWQFECQRILDRIVQTQAKKGYDFIR